MPTNTVFGGFLYFFKIPLKTLKNAQKCYTKVSSGYQVGIKWVSSAQKPQIRGFYKINPVHLYIAVFLFQQCIYGSCTGAT